MNQHELIQTLKNLALELGRTPTRREFISQVKGGEYRMTKLFGSFSTLLQAAGLETHEERMAARKIDGRIFTKDIEKHLAQYQPKPYTPPGPFPRAAIISDIHWPFSCQRVVDAFYEYVESEQPDWVILNGDAWDMYSHSKYPRSHNLFTPREEERLSREMNEAFWKEIQKRAPNTRPVQMMGNHDLRPMKRVLEVYPEAEDWMKDRLEKLFTFDGVKTIFDFREELYLNKNTIVFHGYRSKLGDHRDYTLMNCINGHTHVGGVVWRQIRTEVLFEANSGIAGDPYAKGLTYTPQKVTHWTPGFLAITEHAPMFIPA
jgi:predicted phosphodiesterase